MLMPRPAVIQWRKTATAQARQLNMNNAARAPPWRSVKAMLLVQIIFCRSALSRRSVLTNASRGSSLQRFSRSIIVVLLPCAYMMTIVAPLRARDEPSHFLETFVRGLRLQFDVHWIVVLGTSRAGRLSDCCTPVIFKA